MQQACQEKKYMAQVKEQIKDPKIELSDEEIAKLSNAQFKTLVIRMHTLRHIIITLARIEDKERILKAAREKES